ncbi:DNA-binding response regulator [Verrucomicrobia bacterium LW23]|nr:DNA-binding response regulator [Verrucomicrobia bacterium LW23]
MSGSAGGCPIVPVRVALVDDEPLARDRLRRLLKDEPGLEIVAECRDGTEAVEAVRAHAPDLLLLDVQMPGMDGFEALEAMRRLALAPMPEVVFVTGFDHHAVKAFEARALDYLLKPTTKARLAESMFRARERISARRAAPPVPPESPAPPGESAPSHAVAEIPQAILDLLAERRAATPKMRRVPVRNGERIQFVPVEEIDWVEAAGNYVVLHVGAATHILRETMSALEEQLPPEVFYRASRSAIVNLHTIKEILTGAAGEQLAVLTTGHRLPVTRSIRELEEKLRFGG